MNKKNSVYFRADANPKIGMGHVMRCLSIADRFTDIGCSVTFILADDSVAQLIEQRGYSSVVLSTNYTEMEDELKSWPAMSPDNLIVDSYYVTADYMKALKRIIGKNGKLIYIDDVASFPYPVDILVNYNAFGPELDYYKLYSGHPPILILGPAYVPLRAMFRGVEKRLQPKNVKNILISTGGSDSMHVALQFVETIRNWDCIYTFHILIGAMNTDKKAICALSKASNNIILHENVDDMKTLLCGMDIAVAAAGSTLYEAAACGVPLLTYSMSDNQIAGAEAFERLGLAVSVGDLRNPSFAGITAPLSCELKPDSIITIIKEIDRLAEDYEVRRVMAARMQKLVDGFGADRIVKEIMHL